RMKTSDPGEALPRPPGSRFGKGGRGSDPSFGAAENQLPLLPALCQEAQPVALTRQEMAAADGSLWVTICAFGDGQKRARSTISAHLWADSARAPSAQLQQPVYYQCATRDRTGDHLSCSIGLWLAIGIACNMTIIKEI